MNRSDRKTSTCMHDGQKDYALIVLLVIASLMFLGHLSIIQTQSPHVASNAPVTKTFSCPDGQLSLQSVESFSQNLHKFPHNLKPLFFLPINLNYADGPLLETIPGIGSKLSHLIIEVRKQKGYFSHFNELLEVNGIGNKKIAIIKKYTIL